MTDVSSATATRSSFKSSPKSSSVSQPRKEVTKSEEKTQKLGNVSLTSGTEEGTYKFRDKSPKAAEAQRAKFIAEKGLNGFRVLEGGDLNKNGVPDLTASESEKIRPVGKPERTGDGNYEASAKFKRQYSIAEPNAPTQNSTDPKTDPKVSDAYKQGTYTSLPDGVAPQEGYKGERVEQYQRQVAKDLTSYGISQDNVTKMLQTSKSPDGFDGFYGPKTAGATDLRDQLQKFSVGGTNLDYDRLNADLAKRNTAQTGDKATVSTNENGAINLSDYVRKNSGSGTNSDPTIQSRSGEATKDGRPGQYSDDAIRDAQTIRDALPKLGLAQNPEQVAKLLADRTPEQREQIKRAFFDTQGSDLGSFIDERMSGGLFRPRIGDSVNRDAVLGMLNNQRVNTSSPKDDAIAIHDALHGKWFDDWDRISSIASSRSGDHLKEVESMYNSLYHEDMRGRMKSDYGSWLGEPGWFGNTSDYLDTIFAQFDKAK